MLNKLIHLNIKQPEN